jgi:hypothetical protein
MDALCAAVCQRLLLGREVEWVRVSAVSGPRTGSRRVRASQVYSLDAREPCPQAFADAKAVLPETQQAQAQGNCMTANGALENLEKPAGASVVTTSSYRWIFPGRSERVSPSLPEQRRVEITLTPPDLEKRLVAVHTELTMVQLSLLWRIAVTGSDLSDLRLQAPRFREQFAPIDMGDLLRKTLGYRIAAGPGH